MAIKKYRKYIAVIGAGYWGKNLIRIFNNLGVLGVVCDSNKAILKKTKKKYPDIKTVTEFSEILKDEEIKGVIIATPAASHYKLAIKAINSGKDVFVEKPLSLNVKDGKKLIKASSEKKLVLMVGHLLLYHSAVLKLKELIKKGELGEIQYIWSNRLNFGKLRREENVLWSFAPHDISLIIDILGEPQKAISVGRSYLQKEIPDITLNFLEFKKGKAAHIFVSWLNPFKEQKFSVIGKKAMAVFDDQSENKLMIYNHKVKWANNKNPEAIKSKGRVVKISPKEPLMEEARHFLECIEKRKNPKTDGKEALSVLKVLDACQKSLKKGGRAIKLAN